MRAKKISFITAAALLTASLQSFSLYAEEAVTVRGDVNSDGFINSDDITLVQEYAAGKSRLTDDQLKSADVTQDGLVNIFDLCLLKQLPDTYIDTGSILEEKGTV
ncbi:MAG: dockerin type I repeat-containing protein, partial [Oscillospiraceae bacterium]|nr:dockerin type I repeat-containing protein [Oscillospiraceae bacterium]